MQRATKASRAPENGKLSAWAAAALAVPPAAGFKGNADGELTIRLVGVEESRALNHRYRNMDRATNVLAFPAAAMAERSAESGDALAELLAVAPPVIESLGDMAVCVPVVRAEASRGGGDPQAHWAHIVVHGTLHLLGYDHEEEAEATCMESMERQILRQLGFALSTTAEGAATS